MLRALQTLYISPYNKKRPIFAFIRFAEWKLIRLLKLKNYKKKIWKNQEIFINYDSYHSMWVMYNWVVDWEEFNLMAHLLQKDDVCFDVGANMGYYSLWMSRYANQIHSFEPNAENYERLLLNLKLNRTAKVIPNQLGLGSETGEVFFTANKDGENHILLAWEKARDSVIINLDTLSNYLKRNNITAIKYLKIDVEGYEYDVLCGARSYLEGKLIEIIQLEINKSLENSGRSADDIISFLRQYGYKLASYDVRNRRLSPISYSVERENYFAVADIESVNRHLAITAQQHHSLL